MHLLSWHVSMRPVEICSRFDFLFCLQRRIKISFFIFYTGPHISPAFLFHRENGHPHMSSFYGTQKSAIAARLNLVQQPQRLCSPPKSMDLPPVVSAIFFAKNVSELLSIPAEYVPELVIAIGYPTQKSAVVDLIDSVRYTEDDQGNMLVPKYRLKDVLINLPPISHSL